LSRISDDWVNYRGCSLGCLGSNAFLGTRASSRVLNF
jgi:hypothetical protein